MQYRTTPPPHSDRWRYVETVTSGGGGGGGGDGTAVDKFSILPANSHDAFLKHHTRILLPLSTILRNFSFMAFPSQDTFLYISG